jgi:hypothetical protein
MQEESKHDLLTNASGKNVHRDIYRLFDVKINFYHLISTLNSHHIYIYIYLAFPVHFCFFPNQSRYHANQQSIPQPLAADSSSPHRGGSLCRPREHGARRPAREPARAFPWRRRAKCLRDGPAPPSFSPAKKGLPPSLDVAGICAFTHNNAYIQICVTHHAQVN